MIDLRRCPRLLWVVKFEYTQEISSTLGMLIGEWWVTNTVNFLEHVSLLCIKLSSWKRKRKSNSRFFFLKFEQVLKIYWSKGIFYNTKLHSFDLTIWELFRDTGGFNWALRNWIIKRFELYWLEKGTHVPLSSLDRSVSDALNVLFSQITSINHQLTDLHRGNLIRLYLTRTTRGRSHALGKPSRGQRTWSNAWNAYKLNNTTRDFISSYQKMLAKDKKEVKKNYKKVEKKSLIKEKKKGVYQEVVKANFWF